MKKNEGANEKNISANTAAAETSSKRTVSIVVDNVAGVLAKVTNLFSRRGFNIDSLAVGTTEKPQFSRITVEIHATNSQVDEKRDHRDRQHFQRQDHRPPARLGHLRDHGAGRQGRGGHQDALKIRHHRAGQNGRRRARKRRGLDLQGLISKKPQRATEV